MPHSPNVVELPYFEDSQTYFNCLNPLPGCAWLDSGLGSSQCDILCAEPIARFKNTNAALLNAELKKLSEGLELHEFNQLPFTGGLIGYASYEDQHAAFELTRLPNASISNIWHLYDWALVQDHGKRRCTVIFLPSCSDADKSRRLTLLKAAKPQQQDVAKKRFSAAPFQANISREDYAECFKKIQHYIHAGDAYQVNFAQRFSSKITGNVPAAYVHLRGHLSGNYSAYFDAGDNHILSFSPEQFVQISQDEAQTRPIKGTIKRGNTAEEDVSLANMLVNSEKNRAENLMIVDLLRNDFSKNCVPNSVKVPKLFELESYANVHHLVSTVQGKLKSNIAPLDFFNDCFPGGSITGAPKKRAMEIIAELEPHPREIYCGSVAYLSTNGNMDSNIAIRTLLARNGEIYCWGGGGIVADSTEEEEYQESIQKVQVLMSALSDS